MLCSKCLDLFHVRCVSKNASFCKTICVRQPGTLVCCNCILSELPFFEERDLDLAISARDVLPDTESLKELNHINNGQLSTDATGQIDIHFEALTCRPNQLKMIHFNTRSLLSTFDEILSIINEYPLDVIAMSETWYKNNPFLLQYATIPGYTPLLRNRDNIRGSGFGLYIKDSIKFQRRLDIENMEPKLEHLWVEIGGKNRHSKLLLGVLNRPSCIQIFRTWLDKVENLLSYLIASWDGILMVTGGMNIDLLKPEEHQVKHYEDMLESFNLHQHIQHPTRITHTSKTLIDHIISNMPHRITHSDVLRSPSMSDHDASYACVNIRVTRFQPRYKIIRSENFDQEVFTEEFSTLPFNLVYATDDADDKLDTFNTLYRTCIDKYASLLRVKITRPPAPWLYKEDIRDLQRERNTLRRLAHKTNLNCVW